jgi:tetratricopeptide (TPR) repeat protein
MQDVYLQVTAVEPDQRAVLAEDFQQAEDRSKLVGYGKSLEAHPDDPWSREGLAASYLALGKPQDAIRELDARIKIGRPEVHSMAILGMAHFAAGEFEKAEQLERQAIAMDAEYPLAWLGLGKALGAQRKTIEAEAAYRRALELTPTLTDAHLNRADILINQGDVDEAAAACEAALAISPENPNTLLKLAEIRTKQGRGDESLRLLQEAQRLAPYIHPPKVLQAVYLFQAGDPDRARTLLAEAHRDQPRHPVPLLFLGQLARQDGKADTARRDLDTAASLPLPENWPQSHRKRFLILLHSERFELAKQLQDEALARDALTAWFKCEPENKQLQDILERVEAAEKQ